ncbi:hypothetical protein M422DRAFT_72047 [Sphaerobolus stellatus SS14]|uniref:Uncharacterized protein n=1 Tax=Sphaerobolus stellatus (strain SS14) TaxID=990650 RepID=A0A0C9U9M4_SPHS4|nr:hypothetical protein M422DRAFT_72047 [Sphaerobolus stellatus SS14]
MEGASKSRSSITSYAIISTYVLYEFQFMMYLLYGHHKLGADDQAHNYLYRQISFIVVYVLSKPALYYNQFGKEMHNPGRTRNVLKAIFATAIMISNAAVLHFTLVPHVALQLHHSEFYLTLLAAPISCFCSVLFIREIWSIQAIDCVDVEKATPRLATAGVILGTEDTMDTKKA